MSMSVGETGGQYEHIQTEAEMPKHVHKQSLADSGTLSQAAYTWAMSNTARFYSGSDLAVETGGNQPMKIMPPYYATYIWHRTA